MKWIISAVITIVVAMLLYGAWKAKSQLNEGASVIEVSNTYRAMDPISRYGYEWVMKNDSIVNYGVIKTNKAVDDLTSE